MACQERPSPLPTPLLTWTPEPIVPTATRVGTAESLIPSSATTTPVALSNLTPTPRPSPTLSGVTAAPGMPLVERVGVSGDLYDLAGGLAAGLPFGLFMNWDVVLERPSADVTFWQMVRLAETGVVGVSWAELDMAVTNQPGSVWIVGNEPDVIWQDNVTPERYAELYQSVYSFVKERDPTAQIAVGGVTQSTPLRLAYLDRVLAAYETQFGTAMPVDIWTVHAFILREERGSWGVDIPPGMEAQQGMLYEIADHVDMTIFMANIRAFRQWMWQRGYGERPLAVTEFGILMPFEYGFAAEAVAEFMGQTFDFFLTARDESVGYAPDDYRLVQWWFWYSLHDPDLYPTGNLYERQTGQLTTLGEAWRMYMEAH